MGLLFVQKDTHGNQLAGLDDTLSMDFRQGTYDKVRREGLI